MVMICARREAVEALLPEARQRELGRYPFWPTSNICSDWRFFLNGEEISLVYISRPIGGGLGPRDKVAVFVKARERRKGGLAETCQADTVNQSDIAEIRFAVLLRRATDLEYEATGGLAYAMSLLEPVDVGTDACHFHFTGVSSQFNFAG